MKKIMIRKTILIIWAATVLTACRYKRDHDGIYVARIEGEYSVAYDTLIVEGTVVTKRTGYQKIRYGKLLAREYRTRTWQLGSADAPPVRFTEVKLIIGNTTYNVQP